MSLSWKKELNSCKRIKKNRKPREKFTLDWQRCKSCSKLLRVAQLKRGFELSPDQVCLRCAIQIGKMGRDFMGN